jgi:hypothetical protein
MRSRRLAIGFPFIARWAFVDSLRAARLQPRPDSAGNAFVGIEKQ